MSEAAKADESERAAKLEKLVQRSSSDDGLDRDTLARLNVTGWGCDEPAPLDPPPKNP